MVDLSGMTLLRNDPALAARMIEAAAQGDVDAQFAAGLIYAEGRGVVPDLVQAYYWFTCAMQQGDADAERMRRYVASEMDDDAFESARRLVRAAASVINLGEGASATARSH